MADVLYTNKLVEKGKSRKNEIHFVRVGDIDELVVYRFGDASYTAEKERVLLLEDYLSYQCFIRKIS